jgi:hypothetical protein
MNSEERIEKAAKAYVDATAPLGWADFKPEAREWVKAGMQAALEAAGLNELVEALEKIRRGPAKPAPDPIAHSWEAFARHMNGFAVDARMCAYAALTGDKSNG